MEVTASNFESVLPGMLRAIRSSDFAAVDCEFTGLDLTGRRREEYFDDLDQRYARVRTSAQHFLVIQVGLSLFEWCSQQRKYRTCTYNCFVYPRPHGPFDLRFTCQASSLEFLSRHNFDFNKFIYQGIPFLNLSVADEMYTKLEQQASVAVPQGSTGRAAASAPPNRDIRQALRSEEDKQRHRDIVERVRKWLHGGSSAQRTMSDGAKGVLKASGGTADEPSKGLPEGEREGGEVSGGVGHGVTLEGRAETQQEGSGGQDLDVLVFEPMNSFWRAVVYQTLEKEFGKDHFLIEKVPQFQPGNLESLRLVRSNRDAVLEAERARAAEKRARLDQAVGFSRVLRALSEAGTPIVGHNMLLDVAYLVHLFVQPLPPSFDDFRHLVGSFFPGGIYDTKHLALQVPEAFPPFAGTALEAVYTAFASKVQQSAQPPDAAAAGGDQPLEEVWVEAKKEEAGDQAAQQAADDEAGEQRMEASGVALPGDGPALAGTPGSSPLQSEEAGPYLLAESLIETAAPPLSSSDPNTLACLGPKSNGSPVESGFLATAEEDEPPPRCRPVDAMPPVEHAAGFTRYLDTDDGPPSFQHEAGFDAFMTGVAFVGLAKALEARRKKPELVARHLFRASPNRRGGFSGKPLLRPAGQERLGNGPAGGQAPHGSPTTTKVAVGTGSALIATEIVVAEADSVANGALSPADASPHDTVSSVLLPSAHPHSATPLDCDASSPAAASGRRSAIGAAPSPGPQAPPLNGVPEARDDSPVPADSASQEARELRELLEETRGSPVSADALRPYAYRLNLMGSDLPHLPLQGPLIVPDRSHVFHLSGFVEETRSPDIAGRFADLGLGSIDITWIDRSSAFVALRDRGLADAVVDSVLESGWDVDIVRWADFRLRAQGVLLEQVSGQKDISTHVHKRSAANEGEASQPAKGRRLNSGQRKQLLQEEEDAERDGRRVQKPRARTTCTIL